MKTLSQLNSTVAVQTSHFQFRTKINICDLKKIVVMFIQIYLVCSFKYCLWGNTKAHQGGPSGAAKITENTWKTGFSFVKKPKIILLKNIIKKILYCKCWPQLYLFLHLRL